MQPIQLMLLPLVGAIVGSLIAPWLIKSKEHRWQSTFDGVTSRRLAYVDLLSAIEELTETQGLEDEHPRRVAAAIQMNRSIALVDLVAPLPICLASRHAENLSRLSRGDGHRESQLDTLTTLMRRDLGTRDPEYVTPRD